VYGTRRRTARRTAVVVSSANDAETAQAEQDAAAAEAEADQAKKEADAANARADSIEAASAQSASTQTSGTAGSLPIGTIVTTLPAGCTKKVVNNVEYSYDGKNYYRAAFQGSQLVYVTAQP
jgi:uncharacterized membrane protein YqiK